MCIRSLRIKLVGRVKEEASAAKEDRPPVCAVEAIARGRANIGVEPRSFLASGDLRMAQFTISVGAKSVGDRQRQVDVAKWSSDERFVLS